MMVNSQGFRITRFDTWAQNVFGIIFWMLYCISSPLLAPAFMLMALIKFMGYRQIYRLHLSGSATWLVQLIEKAACEEKDVSRN